MDKGLILHTILGLLLLLIPAGALYWLERQKIARLCFIAGRMIVQLLVLCLMVWGLFKFDRPWLSLAWLVVLTLGMSWLVLKRCDVKGKALMPAVAVGLFVGVFVVGMWLLVLVLPGRALDARWFVPVMALLMGHTTSMLIRGLSTYLTALKADEQQYEFLRGNGILHLKAIQPFMRRALLAVIQPTFANLKVLGLTSMPLLLGGLLLGGLSPLHAFILMLSMVCGCISASVLSLGITIFLADRSLFDKFGKQNSETKNESNEERKSLAGDGADGDIAGM